MGDPGKEPPEWFRRAMREALLIDADYALGTATRAAAAALTGASPSWCSERSTPAAYRAAVACGHLPVDAIGRGAGLAPESKP